MNMVVVCFPSVFVLLALVLFRPFNQFIKKQWGFKFDSLRSIVETSNFLDPSASALVTLCFALPKSHHKVHG